jgi:hypothetical protein
MEMKRIKDMKSQREDCLGQVGRVLVEYLYLP